MLRKHPSDPSIYPLRCIASIAIVLGVSMLGVRESFAAGGSLIVKAVDKSTGDPQITRVEFSRADSPTKLLTIRKTVPAGMGVVLDRSVELSLPDASYQFRMIRGPEYRIISGNFALERSSLDEHEVALPRMVDMLDKGWTSGDCCVPTSKYSLPLRMASEDLHLAAVLGEVEPRPIPGRDRDDPIQHEPTWIGADAQHFGGLVLYGAAVGADDASKLPVERLVDVISDDQVRVAIENPFAWQLPVWLASNQVDGIFVLGDWLRLDRKVAKVSNGRGPQGPSVGDGRAVGRWAERIYWNLLEAGFRIPPLAGSGDQAGATPVGYNRLYVADPLDDYQQDGQLEARRVETSQRWWRAAWRGNSVATNGPLLRPRLGGQIPGHVFQASAGEVLQLQPELTLTVRDPVEYLEVVHNGRVHYSARLDEFAKAGGVIPPMQIKESGWVTMRVVTLYEDHFRAAMSAPWYIEFDGKPRVTAEAVDFFRLWLGDYEQRLKQLPPDELARHVPFVRAARTFWAERKSASTP